MEDIELTTAQDIVNRYVTGLQFLSQDAAPDNTDHTVLVFIVWAFHDINHQALGAVGWKLVDDMGNFHFGTFRFVIGFSSYTSR